MHFDNTANVVWRDAIVEVRYRVLSADDVMWEFSDDRYNRIPLPARERNAIKASVLGAIQ